MVLQMTDIQLFQILKQKLGDKEAESLVQFVDSKLKESNEQNLKTLSTKEDIAKLDGKLTAAIEASKAEMIKWTFTFVMGAVVINIVAIIASFFALANLLKK
jgi:hypothetical protein